jgi:hypothetical protein
VHFAAYVWNTTVSALTSMLKCLHRLEGPGRAHGGPCPGFPAGPPASSGHPSGARGSWWVAAPVPTHASRRVAPCSVSLPAESFSTRKCSCRLQCRVLTSPAKRWVVGGGDHRSLHQACSLPVTTCVLTVPARPSRSPHNRVPRNHSACCRGCLSRCCRCCTAAPKHSTRRTLACWFSQLAASAAWATGAAI